VLSMSRMRRLEEIQLVEIVEHRFVRGCAGVPSGDRHDGGSAVGVHAERGDFRIIGMRREHEDRLRQIGIRREQPEDGLACGKRDALRAQGYTAARHKGATQKAQVQPAVTRVAGSEVLSIGNAA
jgi:hypothetical protein